MIRLAGRPYRHVKCLKADIFAENHLLEDPADGRLWVYKLSRPIPALAAREKRLYKRVSGLPDVPELGPVSGEGWFLHGFVPGKTLAAHVEQCYRDKRCISLDLVPDFYARLEQIVRSIHARNVIYMDLSKKANVIVTPEGAPALIDFQISLDFPARRGALLERLFQWLARADLYQVAKHRRRYDPVVKKGLDPGAEKAGRDRALLHKLHGWLVRPVWHFFKRRLLPPEPA